MNAAPQSLPAIQRWLQAVIRTPDGDAAEWIDAVIRPSHALSSRDRVLIYANAYFARLLEVLANEFPAVRQAVGPDVFAEFVASYLRVQPSTSYTLSQLGIRFPRHLTEIRPPRESSEPDWIDFLIEVATLERLYSEVFDGPGIERSPPFDIRGLSPEAWPTSCLLFAPCVRLLTLQFPVHAYVTAVRRGEAVAPPAAAPTQLVVTRREYIVRRTAVPIEEFRLLSLLHDGFSVETALATWADEFPKITPPLREWFERWTQAGYFVAVTDARESSVPDRLAAD